MKVLIVLNSHDELGTTGRTTGFWLEELAAPYYRFTDAGVDVVLASPKGGRPPLDPTNKEPALGVLRHATNPDGTPLVEGKQVTGFTNSEEAAVGLTEVVPFLVEDELTRLGGVYSKGGDWEPYVLQDGFLVTEQSPASSGPAADALLELVAQVGETRA